jgi:hypothetical protein
MAVTGPDRSPSGIGYPFQLEAHWTRRRRWPKQEFVMVQICC